MAFIQNYLLEFAMKCLLIIFLFLPILIFAQNEDSTQINIEKGAIIRDAPNMNAGILGAFKDTVTIYTSNLINDYYRIFWGGKYGYVKSFFITNKVDNKHLSAWKKARRDYKFANFPYMKEFSKKPQNVKTFFNNFFNVPEKGEFESTDDFNKRSSFDSTIIYNFDLEPSSEYDADEECFYADIINIIVLKHGFPKSYLLKEERKKIRTYSAQNSFGVTANVNEYKGNEYLLIEKNGQPKLYDFNDRLYDRQAQFDCPKEKAKSVKNILGVRIGITFESYKDRLLDTSDITPTIDGPVKEHIDRYCILGKIKYIIGYNKKTNEIYNAYYID